MSKVAVIVPAAGSGQRFGGEQNKIFTKIGQSPLFIRTLEAFCNRPDVIQTLLVASKEDLPQIKERFGGHLGFMGVSLTQGGQTRSRSVRNALKQVLEEADLVAIHDAVRPCISQVWINAVFAEAEKTGAALLALPLHGTLKRIGSSSVVDETLPREQYNNLWEAQTPQVFARELLQKAYDNDNEATDDSAMVEAMGHSVTVVAGDPRNIKVTTKADLAFAASVVGTLPRPRENRPFHPFQDEMQ